mgnify:FL=1
MLYPIIISCIIIYFIRAEMFKTDFSSFDKYLVIIMMTAFCIGILLQIFRFAKPDPLRGELNGFITFNMDEIIADDSVFKLNEINKIEITNDDYYGKGKGNSKGSFNSNLSNGVDNQLIITLKNGENKTYNYELYDPNDLQKVQDVLINYNLKDKLDFPNLINILGITKERALQEFKHKIHKSSSK